MTTYQQINTHDLRPLGATVAPFADEPAHGFFGRLAERNGIDKATLASDLELSLRAIDNGYVTDWVAFLGRVDTRTLARSTFVADREQSRVFLADEILHEDDWSASFLTVCPECLRHDLRGDGDRTASAPHIRSWWNIRHMRACPIHRVRHVEAHPVTGEALDPQCTNPRFAAGREIDLSKMETEPAPATAESYILGRLGFTERLRSEILDAMPLYSAIRAMDRVGAVATGGLQSYSYGPNRNVEPRDALEAGAGILLGRAENFVAFLDDLFEKARPAKGKWAMRPVYGSMYDWLYRSTDTAFDGIREIVREHAFRRIPLEPHVDETIFGVPLGERRVLTIFHLSREVGFHDLLLRKVLVAMGEIDEATAARENWAIHFDRKRADDIVASLAGKMSFVALCEHLGLPRGAGTNLLHANTLPVAFEAGISGVPHHVFLPADVDRWVEDLARGAPWCDEAPAGFCDIVQAAKRAQLSAPMIVQAIKDGRFHVEARLKGAKPFLGLLVDPKKAGNLRSPPPPGMITVEEAMIRMGTAPLTAFALVKHGFIPAESFTIFRGRKAMFIREEDFDEFCRTYVSAHEVATARGTHVRSLAIKLRELGLQPAFNVDLVHKYFYRRQDIQRLVDEGALDAPR